MLRRDLDISLLSVRTTPLRLVEGAITSRGILLLNRVTATATAYYSMCSKVEAKVGRIQRT